MKSIKEKSSQRFDTGRTFYVKPESVHRMCCIISSSEKKPLQKKEKRKGVKA
jgi:hypothetical protein